MCFCQLQLFWRFIFFLNKFDAWKYEQRIVHLDWYGISGGVLCRAVSVHVLKKFVSPWKYELETLFWWLTYFNFSERIRNVGAHRPTKMPHLSACASSSAVSPEARLQARIDAMIDTRPATNSILDNITLFPFYYFWYTTACYLYEQGNSRFTVVETYSGRWGFEALSSDYFSILTHC